MKFWSKFLAIIMLGFVVFGLYSFVKKKEKFTYVEISTVYGDMKFKLYNETPLHKENFIKLTHEKFFDSLLFHRVIKNFMIQGGDPSSKGAKEGAQLGNGGPGYQIDAEFIPTLIHKKGVLAAAREGDRQNPLKKSSGSQFYIVQGQVFDSAKVMSIQENRINGIRQLEIKKCLNDPKNEAMLSAYNEAMKFRDEAAGKLILDSAEVLITPILEKYKYTREQMHVYGTLGGTPHLDFAYTVFGEMIEGFDVLDSIALVQTDRNNRPMQDMMMQVRIVKK